MSNTKDTVASQLDSVTVGKICTLIRQGMKPVGVVMMDGHGKRATIDMGRVTWTGQNVERGAISDAEIYAAAKKNGLLGAQPGTNTWEKALFSCVREILTAQADAKEYPQ